MKEVGVALSGSGFRLSAHVGALQSILDHGYTIHEIAGVSGGSLVSAAYAKGISPVDMMDLIHKTPFKKFINLELEQVLLKGVLNDGSDLLDWLNKCIGPERFKDIKMPLTVVATDLNRLSSYIFNSTLTPEFSVALACRYSSSIPVVFEAGQFDGHYLVDGGVSNDLPVNHLSDSNMKIAVQLAETAVPLTGVVPITTLASRILDTFMDSASDELISYEKNCILIKISTPPGLSLDANLNADQINHLYKLGYDATSAILEKL